jgi:hypothetical protein
VNLQLLWVTRKQPHVDRCASAWLIRRWIDKEAKFEFISKEDPIPKGAIAFTLPTAEIKPVEGRATTYDALLQRYSVTDELAVAVGRFVHDFEIDAAENSSKVRFKETLGLCYVLKGLEKVSRTDGEIIERASMILDAFCSSAKEAGKIRSS